MAPIGPAEYGVLVRNMMQHYQKIAKAAQIKLD